MPRRPQTIEVIRKYEGRDMSAEVVAILWKYRDVLLKTNVEVKQDAEQQSKSCANS